MNPFRNTALQSTKLQSPLNQQQPSGAGMPPPPAYHMVVDPTAPLPNMRNPYDADDEEREEEEDVPDININAMTQVRGHGNIISIAQMDSERIASLIVALFHGSVVLPQAMGSDQHSQIQEYEANRAEQTQGQDAHQIQQPEIQRREIPQIPKFNIIVNCGATVIGDRNIVGPGLGEIARHIQVAQRNQLAQQQQQQQQQPNQTNANQATSIPNQGPGSLVGGETQVATPPMSRSSSFESPTSPGLKRKAEDAGESGFKRTC
jgi:hypothetical protein